MWIMLHNLFGVMGDHFRRGGDVMPPLLIISIVMWLLIFRIGWQLVLVGRGPSLQTCLDSEKKGKTKGRSWQQQLLDGFLERRSGAASINHRIMEELILRYRNRTRRYINTVLILAAAAPLLGLLGTVMGMVATFDTIGKFGTGNARAMAAGISEALITTQTGLIISIPGLFVGTLLKGRLDALEDRIRRFGLGIVNHFDQIRAIGSSAGKQAVSTGMESDGEKPVMEQETGADPETNEKQEVKL